jgi:ribosomal protein S18 acetylase RimI-like enzyme
MIIRLRAETASDEAFVRRVILETVAEELGAGSWPEPMRSQLLDLQCAGRRHGSVGFSRIIEAGGGDAGWVLVETLEREILLMEIMVPPELREKGIGTAALTEVLAEARAQGKAVRLHVAVMNGAAIRLYERMGFRKIDGDEVRQLMEASFS